MLRFIFLFGMVGSFACPLFASKSNGNEPTEKALYKASGCIACHRMTLDHIGPSMLAVSQKYANDPNGVSMVLDSLKNGAKGKWGNNVMPPQSHVSDHNLQLLTNWVLTIKGFSPSGKLAERGTCNSGIKYGSIYGSAVGCKVFPAGESCRHGGGSERSADRLPHLSARSIFTGNCGGFARGYLLRL